MLLTALINVGYRDAIFAWPNGLVSQYDELVRLNTRRDPQWTADFLRWLRTETPMRYPALVGTAAFVSERLASGQHGMSRQVVNSVLRRADDPGHLLAHWIARYGRRVPKPVKRGVADAVVRLYHEDALRYDTDAHHVVLPNFINHKVSHEGGIGTPRPLRFGDVIALVHPVARDEEQSDFFRHVVARRHGQAANRSSEQLTVPRRRVDREVWDGLVASMSVADLVACLRRFDARAIPFETAMTVAGRIKDPVEVSASGMLPLTVFAAQRALRTERWFPALAEAAARNVPTIPTIPGRTLIVVDPGNEVGVVFALTLAQRCADVDVVTRADQRFDLIPGELPLKGLLRFQSSGLWHAAAPHVLGVVPAAWSGHDRVVVVGEELYGIDEVDLPPNVPMYVWQTMNHSCRYCRDHDLKPHRLLFYGLTDDAFTVIPLVEAARQGQWPW